MSLDMLAQMDWTTLIMGVVLVVVAWFVVRAVFKLAVKVFTCGCLVIFLVVGALVLARWLSAQAP